jgi:hypothetical protein
MSGRDDDQGVSLYGLDPEEALRALLAVDPDSPPVEPDDEPDDDEAPAD